MHAVCWLVTVSLPSGQVLHSDIPAGAQVPAAQGWHSTMTDDAKEAIVKGIYKLKAMTSAYDPTRNAWDYVRDALSVLAVYPISPPPIAPPRRSTSRSLSTFTARLFAPATSSTPLIVRICQLWLSGCVAGWAAWRSSPSSSYSVG